MQLVINTFGAYLRKKDDLFLVKTDKGSFEISPKKVSSILISTSAIITTDAIKLAMDYNIDVIFVDEYGNPYARIWHSKLGSTVLIRRRQLEYSFDERGVELAKSWVIAKLEHQIEFMKKLLAYRERRRTEINQAIKSISGIILQIKELNGNLDKMRGSLLGLEGSAGRVYFDMLNKIMPNQYKFNGRSRMPARDAFNAMLNYGYGILYSMVEKACIIAGLDPYIGFVHTDNYNKKSLIFDLMELFRIYVEKVVVYQFTQKFVKKDYFDRIPGGVKLNAHGKKFFLMKFNDYFDKRIRYGGRNIKIRDIIQFELHKIANNFIKGE